MIRKPLSQRLKQAPEEAPIAFVVRRVFMQIILDFFLLWRRQTGAVNKHQCTTRTPPIATPPVFAKQHTAVSVAQRTRLFDDKIFFHPIST
jgi:hypothetical protein